MMKKIWALVLAVVMIMTMTAIGFAAGDAGRTVPGTATNTYTGTNNANAISVANGTTIPLTKSIVFSNINNSNVYEPNITYTYTVTPETIDESTYTVTDSTPLTGYVHPGVANGVTGVSIQFGTTVGGEDTTAVTTTAAGVEVERTANLSVDITKFTKPGIYRYKIVETSSPATVTEVGLTARDSEYNPDRYLDVYIHYVDHDNDPSTPEVLKMYGAVIFKSTAETAGQDNITTRTTKTTGYEPSATSGDLKDDATVDRYTTYDIIVKKTVDGSMADKNHEFPFFVTVSNTINGAKFSYTADGSETFTGATVASGVGTLTSTSLQIGSDAKTSSLTLKHNDQITIKGIPSNQTTDLAIVVKEFNDTYDSYTPSVSATSGTISMTTGTAMTAQSGFDVTTSFAIKANDTKNQTITLNNNLTEISPTGVVLRVAPYVMILVAGIALLILAKKRKPAKDEE